MCLCVVWACSIFYFGYGWSIGQRGIRNCGNLSVWQPGVVEMSGRLLCFPWLLRLGDQCCRLGWAWLVEGEGDRGTLRGFGSALIRVIITTGTRIHTHIHTLAVVFATGVCPDSCGFPGAEVITCSAILHGGLRYHSGCRINCLSSLCEQFLSPRAPEEATGKERDKKAEKMRVNMHGWEHRWQTIAWPGCNRLSEHSGQEKQGTARVKTP